MMADIWTSRETKKAAVGEAAKGAARSTWVVSATAWTAAINRWMSSDKRRAKPMTPA